MHRAKPSLGHKLVFLAAACAILVNCGIPSLPLIMSPTQAPRAAAPTAALKQEPTPPPNPLSVRVSFDNKLSATAVISTTGGTVTAQAAGGSAGAFGGISASTWCSETTALELIHKPQK